MGIIYLLTNKKNGKCFVGLDSRDFRARLKEHIRNPNSDHPTLLIDRAMKKYSPENFEYKEIDETKDINELKKLEQFYIALFRTSVYTGYGYNLTKGGDGCFGFKMPLDKIHKGATHYLNGKKQSIETKNKISKSMKEIRCIPVNPFTLPEDRVKLSEYAKKRKCNLNPNYKNGRRINGKRDLIYTHFYYTNNKIRIRENAKTRYYKNHEKELARMKNYSLTHKRITDLNGKRHWVIK